MPTYQYACTTCGHHLEAVQSFTDEPLTECPECEGRLRKLFSAVGIVFKGSGFYRTDSRKNGAEVAANGGSKTDAAAKSEGAKSEGARSDGAKSDGAKSEGGAKTGGSDSSGTASTSTSTTSSGSTSVKAA